VVKMGFFTAKINAMKVSQSNIFILC